MPVFLVNAASTSSSAFFIEAAAKTVRVLSCACAGELAVVQPAVTASDDSTKEAMHLNMGRSMRFEARLRAPSRQGQGSGGRDRSGSAVPGLNARLRRAADRTIKCSRSRPRRKVKPRARPLSGYRDGRKLLT